MSWVITGVSKPPLLLDAYPGAAAAYSLRSLSLAYGGSVVRVRRSSDNTEADFTATQVSDGSLAAFVGAGNNGFVRTWYDQSGNGKNAEQTTTASQPQIVSSGSVVATNTKPAILLDGTNDHFNLPTFGSAANHTVYAVTAPISYAAETSINARWYDVITSNASLQLLRDNTTQNIAMKNSVWQTSTSSTTFASSSPTSQKLFSSSFLSSSNAMKINSASLSLASAAIVGAAGSIGKIGVRADLVSSAYLYGTYQELIIYPIDQSANNAAIETNINAHYTIY
jgi:hypothetical protein